MTTDTRKVKQVQPAKPPSRRVVAVGKWTDGQWQVRTSMWRYLTAYVISKS
jgi:hypothetical protein